MSLGTFTKQPIEKLDYDVLYEDWLTPGDGLGVVNVTIDKPGLTSPRQNVSASALKVWIAGGTDGVTYKVTVTAETDDGRIKQDEFKIKVKED
ncbi:phage fiber-tail adaptor protein [Massilia antarctica]|uniref:phage fiber-tail adaptor protein n=1 Tax=Massilia antarctica TaxID=2765360 RepID=UPI0035ED3803